MRYAHYIVIVRHEYRLYYYEHGALVRGFDVALGRPGYRTPLGYFHIYGKRKPAGGALGACAMFYRHLGGIAIHGTDQPYLIRRPVPRDFSHGCARMLNRQVLWLYARGLHWRSLRRPRRVSGVAAWKRRPVQSATFRVDLAAGETWAAAFAETSVGVRHRVLLAAVARTPVLQDEHVRYTVTVRPAHPGATVQLQRWTAGGWAPLQDLTLGADSQATVSLLAGAPGRLVVRADMAADAEHLAGHSAPWKVTVYDRRNPYGVPTKYPHLILVDLSQYKLYYHEHGLVVRVFDVRARVARRCRRPGATSRSTPRTRTCAVPTGRTACATSGCTPSTAPTSRGCSTGTRATTRTAARGSRTPTSRGCTRACTWARRSGTCRELRPAPPRRVSRRSAAQASSPYCRA